MPSLCIALLTKHGLLPYLRWKNRTSSFNINNWDWLLSVLRNLALPVAVQHMRHHWALTTSVTKGFQLTTPSTHEEGIHIFYGCQLAKKKSVTIWACDLLYWIAESMITTNWTVHVYLLMICYILYFIRIYDRWHKQSKMQLHKPCVLLRFPLSTST